MPERNKTKAAISDFSSLPCEQSQVLTQQAIEIHQPKHDPQQVPPQHWEEQGLLVKLLPSLFLVNKWPNQCVGWPQFAETLLFQMIQPSFQTSPIHAVNLNHLLRDTSFPVVQANFFLVLSHLSAILVSSLPSHKTYTEYPMVCHLTFGPTHTPHLSSFLEALTYTASQ